MKYFIIGIKGTGASALARILYDKGNDVCGSDCDDDFFTTDGLKNIKIYPLGTFLDDYFYILGNAYVGSSDHLYLINNNIPFMRYNDFIGKMEGIGIAVSGTHGKTTTTSLLSHLFRNERCDYLIGDGTGHGLKDNDYFIYEACEYRKHFLAYSPNFLIITNIEYEHTDFYDTIDDVIAAFQELVNKSDVCLVNGDDINIRRLEGENIISFGFNNDNDYVIELIKENYPYRIKITHNYDSYYYDLPFFGKYMIYNSAASIITALINNITNIQDSINTFSFPKRRMTEYRIGEYLIVDDYAHHPTEIINTLEAIRDKYNRDICLVFEPHTYSRTLDLMSGFVEALNRAQKIFITDVFSSVREKGGNPKLLLDNVANSTYFSSIDQLKPYKDMVIVFMGAGTVYKYINDFY